MHRRDVAGEVDRHRAADRRGHLEPSAEAGISEEKLLAVGELDRRHVSVARNLRDTVEIRADLAPAPAMRLCLHLIDTNPPPGERPTDIDTAILEPRALRRRVGLSAQPDVQAIGLAIEFFHRFARR
jgi:hypothetical protein